MKIFNESGNMKQSAYFGWQSEDLALYGLREGYKNSADDLVEIALKDGSSTTLDTYIFPILFSYRHSLEISLKHIYYRYLGSLPKGGHNLLALWDKVEIEVIVGFINNASAIEKVKSYKKNFNRHSIEGISLSNIRLLLKEFQEANQKEAERT
ncbi:MAG: hypothetical protein RR653_14655, partial [Clostridia bacterium]